jgi:hypothetical protein
LWTFEEVTKEIAQASNRDIQFSSVSKEEYIGFMKQAGVPSDYVWLMDYLFTHVLVNPSNSVVTSDVETVLKRPAKDFAVYAKETAATGVWNVN